jgi:hypothetical protein
VVDQRLHRLVDASAWWRRDLLVLDPVVARWQQLEDLVDDLDRLAHLVEADGVAVERVAVGADDDVELDLRVAEVGQGPAQVPGHARRPQQRPGRAEGDRLLGGDDADALQPLPPDGLAGHQRVVLLEPRRDHVEEAQDVVAPAVGEIGGHAAGTDVVVVHPQPGDLLEEPQHLLALAPAVEHHRHGADVHAVGGEEQDVRRDPVELAHEHADPLGPLGDVVLDAEQRLGGQREDQLVEQGGRVVHAGHVGGALEVGELLARLLHPRVQVADDRLRAQDRLALQLEHEAQHAVGAGVLWPHVDDHRLVFARLGLALQLGRLGFGQAQHRADLAQQLVSAEAAALAQLLAALPRLGGAAVVDGAHRTLPPQHSNGT